MTSPLQASAMCGTRSRVRTLYIVGNGFDLHHGIPSRYSDFGKYLCSHDSEVYQYVQDYLSGMDADFWSEFEENLANLDSNLLREYASESLVGYGAADWSDAYHHDYQDGIEQVVKSLTSKLSGVFTNWIRQLPIPTLVDLNRNLLSIDSGATFLNFNYTLTLQNIYSIAAENILHIHGSSAGNSKIILGHGWSEERIAENFENEEIDIDTRIYQGNEIIRGYFKKTSKPTAQILEENQSFFTKLESIESIFVLGHSLGEVDLPYFRKILENINKESVMWNVSYYEGKETLESQITKLGISQELVEYIRLDELRMTCGGF